MKVMETTRPLSSGVVSMLDRMGTKVTIGDGCWEWTGARIPAGYGTLTYEGRTQSAHRLMYELLVGPIPAGLHIDHLCRNKWCVRPDHLEPVTASVNKQRAWDAQPRATHCKRGHAYDEANTILFARGRQCRACVNIARRARKKRKCEQP